MTDEFKRPKLLSPLDVLASTDIDWEEFRLKCDAEREKQEAEARWQREHGWKDPSIGTCVVCGGRVFGRVRREFISSSGPLVIGPGSRQQFHNVHKGYDCEDCYLMYKKCPGVVRQMTRQELELFKG